MRHAHDVYDAKMQAIFRGDEVERVRKRMKSDIGVGCGKVEGRRGLWCCEVKRGGNGRRSDFDAREKRNGCSSVRGIDALLVNR